MIVYGIIQAALFLIVLMLGARIVRNYERLERKYTSCKRKNDYLSSLDKPQYDNVARVIKDCDFSTGECFYLVYLVNGANSNVVRLRRFDYQQNDKDDEEYAHNCAVELTESLNADYRITK